MYVLSLPLSYGQRRLIELVDKRIFAEFCRAKGITLSYTYRIATGKFNPQNTLIWYLRDFIHPAQWFYNEGEEYNEIPFKPKKIKVWDYDKTIAMIDFRKKTTVEIREIANKHDIPYLSLYNVYHGRYAPSFKIIFQLKKTYNPELWFMFQNERR